MPKSEPRDQGQPVRRKWVPDLNRGLAHGRPSRKTLGHSDQIPYGGKHHLSGNKSKPVIHNSETATPVTDDFVWVGKPLRPHSAKGNGITDFSGCRYPIECTNYRMKPCSIPINPAKNS